MVTKGQGANKKQYYFSAYGKTALELSRLSKGFRIKIWFTITTNEHNGKYYTNLKIESFEHWIPNEDKLKKEQRKMQMEQDQVKIEFTHKTNNF